MRSFAELAALAGLASASPAGISDYIRAAGRTPMNSNSFPSNSTSQEPCAIASREWGQSEKGLITAEVAYQCLRSVPIHTEEAILQVQGIKAFSEFQSTIAYLDNPPEGYLYPAADILNGLDQIIDKLNNSGYTREYDLQLDVYDLINSAFDGHFNFMPDLLSVISFGRGPPVFSVSKDGLTLPEIYLGEDVHFLSGKAKQNHTVSPVVQINGQDVEAWLNSYASVEHTAQDPDANYNALFPTGPNIATSGGSFASFYHYPGKAVTFSFRNGTTSSVETLAVSRSNLTGVTDGESLFQRFCTQEGQEANAQALLDNAPPTTTSSAPPVIPTTEVPFRPIAANLSATFKQAPTFPKPIVASDDGSIAGYFPADNKDLAVLSISTFAPADTTQFANTVRIFLATAQKYGKTKLMIDLRGNGGGIVTLAYDLFGQLFPRITPYGATNFRATPLLNDTGIITSDHYSNLTNAAASDEECGSNFSLAPFNYRQALDENNEIFTSWEDYYGPHAHYGDNFTSLSRYNLNNKFSIFCANVSNHGNLTHITPQVFQPDDVVIVQDGGCASTCAVFSEFMKAQAHVKQIVFGGRKQTGPMQGVGAVKGANVYGFSLLQQAFTEATEDATPQMKKHFLEAYGNLTKPATQAIIRAAVDSESGYPAKQARVNIRNNIRYGDESVTPLQFVYEAADCRFFNTAEMIFDQTLVWEAAYQARWLNRTCVAGSTGHPSSAPDSDAIFAPPESARNFFGADKTSSWPVSLRNHTGASTTEHSPAATTSGGYDLPTGITNLAQYTGEAVGVPVRVSFAALVGVGIGFMLLV